MNQPSGNSNYLSTQQQTIVAATQQSSFPSQQPTQPPNHYYPQPTRSFVPAPAPVLNDDGDITVVSALTTVTTAPLPTASVPYNNQLAPAVPPSTSNGAANVPVAMAVRVPEAIVPKSVDPKTIATASTLNTNQEVTEIVARQTPKVSNETTALTYHSRPTTLTTNAQPRAVIVTRVPHKTYPAEVERMKVRRKRATVAAGVTGGVVGLIALGPVGALVGGAGASVATRAIGKRRERKKRDKIAERRIAEQQRDAPGVLVHNGTLL